MKALLALALAMSLGAPQTAPRNLADQPSNGVSFDFTPRPDSHVSPYILSVPVDGSARYIAFPSDDPNGPAAQPVVFKVSDRALQRLLSAYIAVSGHAAQGSCETRAKGIASTGKKLLTYYRDGNSFACKFDHADDASINGVAQAFEAIAATLQFGERLQHDLRYDRLSLDAEIDALVTENADGRAIEIQSIAPTLQSIVDDDRVMERVRRKAARLLQAATMPSPQLPRPTPR